MIVSFVLSTVLNCTGGNDLKTIAAKEKIHELVAQDVAQYQSCLTDDDCTYFARIGGFVLNKRGISFVSNCTLRLREALFPQCYLRGVPHIGEFGMDPKPEEIPQSATCVNNKCSAAGEIRRDWWKENYAAHKTFKQSKPDELCQKFLNDIKKSSNSGR